MRRLIHPEHDLARLLVHRPLVLLADRESGLQLRPGTKQRIPAFDIREFVQRQALRNLA